MHAISARRASRAILILAAVSVVSLLWGGAATASAKQVRAISNCKSPKYKPAMFIIACGDAGLIAQNLSWSSWTRNQAVGAGTGDINTCNPNCASGNHLSAPISLTLSKPRTCPNGARIFTKLFYRWTGAVPTGVPSGSVPIGCKLLAL
jgi:hypothetical protein